MTQGRGRPRGFGEDPVEYRDRFQKFYYKNRERLNDDRRELYQERKKKGICVRCMKRSMKDSVFCMEHRLRTRKGYD